jgi:hypothetical protein
MQRCPGPVQRAQDPGSTVASGALEASVRASGAVTAGASREASIAGPFSPASIPVTRAELISVASACIPPVVDEIFSLFDRADADAEALAPAVRTVLDPAAERSARAAAIEEIRASGIAFEAALRAICDGDADLLAVRRAVFESALAERCASDVELAACFAVETAAMLGEHDLAIGMAERALAAAPENVALAILLANARANTARFDPAVLAALRDRDLPISLRRRIDANLGVACLATGAIPEAFAAWRRAGQDARVLMWPDIAVSAGGEPVWIQRMRTLLQLDGLGELAATWGIGGPRMVVLLEGLAGAVGDAEAARSLRAEAEARLRAGRERSTPDPEGDEVTLDELLADAADFARMFGLDELAARL